MPVLSQFASGFGPIRDRSAELTAAGVIALLSFIAVYRFGLTMIIGGILCVAVLCLVSAKPKAATLVVLLVLYSNAAAVAARNHEALTPFAVGFFLLLFLPMLNFVVARREPVRTDTVFWLMMIYFVILIVSALLSRNPADSTRTIVIYVFQGMSLYFLIINTVRSPAIVRRAVWILLLTGSLLGGLSWYQDLTRTYDNSYGGFAATRVISAKGEVIRSKIDTGEESRGRGVSRLRASGPIKDPNFFGQILVAVLPFGVVFAISEHSQRLRLIAAVACVPIVAGIIVTYSRGAAITVIVLGICLFFLRYFKLRYAVLFSTAIAIVIAATPAYRYRISTLAGTDSDHMVEAESSVKERATILRSGVAVFLAHPVVGVGPGQSPNYVGGGATEFRIVRGLSLHNTYLEQLVETGIVGFSCFIAIAFVTLRNLLRTSRYWIQRRPEYAHVATGLFLSVVAFLTTSLFLHLAFVRYYTLFLGLSGAAVLVYAPEMSEPPLPRAAASKIAIADVQTTYGVSGQ